ncbi:MAG: Mrp/NBP35 family ATP-binding protein [Gemmatimonadetes bacterium]|nr:Mrp/NBP35 family ATP-binding protein [Gemmatimonadota bacterium]
MSEHDLKARIAAALTGVVNPRAGRDVISAGMVKEIAVENDGLVRIAFELGADDPAELVRETRRAAQSVEGVRAVRVDVRGAAPTRPTTPKTVPPPAARELPHLGRVLAVSSGKGGVGKSTITTNLAAGLAARGHRVGLMDADVYGPNLPRMFGVMDEQPAVVDRRIQPIEAHGVKLISIGNLVERDVATIWRGPIITKIIQQFLGDVEWGQLDYFLVDLPPGTGDAQLSLVQSVHVAAGLIVTTPQDVAVGDALRGAKMFEKVGVPVLGIVENMSFFACPHCGERTDIFASGGGGRLAEQLGLPLLAEVPLQARVQELCEAGIPVVLAEPDSPAALALTRLAERVEQEVAGLSVRLPVVAG